jgi:WXG100 family type VII secretion target
MQGQNVVQTEEILNLANKIEKNNNNINTTLKAVKTEVDNLSRSWSGEAATATTQAVDSFAAEYYDKYKEMIEQYVDYLRTSAAEGFETTESSNQNIGQGFID